MYLIAIALFWGLPAYFFTQRWKHRIQAFDVGALFARHR